MIFPHTGYKRWVTIMSVFVEQPAICLTLLLIFQQRCAVAVFDRFSGAIGVCAGSKPEI
jgi:hypothetical protein